MKILFDLIKVTIYYLGNRSARRAASCRRVQITPRNFLANGNIFQVKGFVKYFSREAQAWSVRDLRGGKSGKIQLLKLFLNKVGSEGFYEGIGAETLISLILKLIS